MFEGYPKEIPINPVPGMLLIWAGNNHSTLPLLLVAGIHPSKLTPLMGERKVSGPILFLGHPPL